MNKQTHGCCCWLGAACMQHKVERLSGKHSAAVKPTCGGQVEHGWRATHLNDQRMKGTGVRSFLGDPQSVSGPCCFSDNKLVRLNIETRGKARCIGPPGFAHHFAGGNPQKRPLRAAGKAGQRKRKTTCRRAVAHGPDHRQPDDRAPR